MTVSSFEVSRYSELSSRGLFITVRTFVVQNRGEMYRLDTAEVMTHGKLQLWLVVQLVWCFILILVAKAGQ